MPGNFLGGITMTEIGLKNIAKYYAAEKVLHNVSFAVNTGEKIGIVGENGGGKTTLFKVIAGLEGHDGGSLTVRKGATIGLLDQIPSYPSDYTTLDVLNTAFVRELELKRQMTALEGKMGAADQGIEQVLKHYTQVQLEFEIMGGYRIEDTRARICTGLQLADAMLESKFTSLSGGEKTVICVAKMLLEAPDILLLDEPSNHLDIEAVEWLESYLSEYAGTVLIISHDRYFLDRSVKKIIEIDNGEAEIYHGNYTYYVGERERRLTALFDAYTDQQKKIKAMEQAIKRFREWGIQGDNPKFFRKAASIQKQLDKLEKIDRPQLERDSIKLSLKAGQRSGSDVLVIQDLYKSYSAQQVLKGLNFHLRYGEKAALVGPNGCGKTTLLKLILGAETPDRGMIELGSGAKIGFLEQNVVFPDSFATVLETFREKCPMPEGQARSVLAKFLFFGVDVFKSVAALSGGERSRLRLGQLMHQDINLLILDEPTNHLDIPAREMLGHALAEFNGTLLFVSHDRYFINSLAERVAELRAGRIINYPGNYDYYRSKSPLLSPASPLVHKEKPKNDRPRSKKGINPFKLQQLENKVEELENQLSKAHDLMEIHAADYKKLEELQQGILLLEAQLEQAWEQLETLFPS